MELSQVTLTFLCLISVGSMKMAHCPLKSKAIQSRATTVMVFMLLIPISGTVTATSETSSNPSGVLRHLVKGTYLLYTNGVQSNSVYRNIMSLSP